MMEKKVALSITEVKKRSGREIEKVLGKYWSPRQILFRAYFIFSSWSHAFFAIHYWMDKFRNISADATDATQRTSLQSHFASASTVCNSIPFTISMLISTRYGHKIKARKRVLWSLILMTICFMIATCFIKINTDSWQTLFFIVTMATLATINALNATLEIGSLVLLAKFPPSFMNMYLLGEGFSGIFNSSLQVITLAIGTSTTASALLYFVFGTFTMLFSSILFHFTKYNKYYMHFINNSVEDTKKDVLPFSEVKALLKVVWPIVLAFQLMDLAKRPTHTAITSLVVSENFGSGSSWSDVYFVPVVTFLYSDVTTLLGRIIASKINKEFKTSYLSIFMFLRILVFVPLFFLCNAQPRNHLPVLIPHDWQYIVILGIFSLSNGYLFNMIFLNISKVVEPDKREDAYMVFMTVICSTGALLSPVGLFAVDIL
ncbi:hypothetical protein NQ318_007586 [Aromia moschata]|uniref:Uncharacterized protein n=1 Tax=Aromia moschata TaxID=1265417 RepID=A0AAV8YCG0_9CUCU|nr:hypothetical protein NQ318_007586 [Aromia moschata]